MFAPSWMLGVSGCRLPLTWREERARPPLRSTLASTLRPSRRFGDARFVVEAPCFTVGQCFAAWVSGLGLRLTECTVIGEVFWFVLAEAAPSPPRTCRAKGSVDGKRGLRVWGLPVRSLQMVGDGDDGSSAALSLALLVQQCEGLQGAAAPPVAPP
jgi:hypothetical protein